MGKTKKKRTQNEVESVVVTALTPIVKQYGVSIWNVELKIESGATFLVVEIDSENPLDLDLCEKISRELDAELDRLDPIEEAYFLEVGSAGLERTLKNAWHFERMAGRLIQVKLFAPHSVHGKEFKGTIHQSDDMGVCLSVLGEELKLTYKEIAHAKLAYVPIDEI